MMKLSAEEIIKADRTAEIIKPAQAGSLYVFSTDTRTIADTEKTAKCIYIPLKGENFDGEMFIPQALEKGAAGYFTSDKTKILKDAETVIYTPDAKETYLKLAEYYKQKINPFTITVTGSSGKTTVKEMLYSVFNLAGKTVKSILNHNNEIGLCQTIAALEPDAEYLIIEAGMRLKGEIELISNYSKPDIGIITNSGSAHIGRLGSLLNIAEAKFEITRGLKKDGVLIAHNNPLIKQINDNKHKTIYFDLKDAKIKEMTENYSIFDYKGFEYKLSAAGEHNVQNALCVIEAGLYAGLNSETIKQGLLEFKPIEKRWQVQKIGKFNIINDCYNSNPESVKAALKTFLELMPAPNAVILGDMGELGSETEKYHAETGKFIEQFDCDYVLTLGGSAVYIKPVNKKTMHFDSKKELVSFIRNNLPAGCNILLKASRFMKFEEIIEDLKK